MQEGGQQVEDVAGRPSPPAAPSRARRGAAAALTLGALGVVFGDIGTSPLYAFREVVAGPHPISPDPDRIRGVLSLIFWSLTVVVTVKFVMFIMRADNDGEGGIMALVALIKRDQALKISTSLVLLGIAGAALFYGDGAITPAISVLSAVEGLEIVSPRFTEWVVPLAVVILAGLFILQRRGTGAVGALFGPVMLVWFACIGALGAVAIAGHPSVLPALSPTYGAQFFLDAPGRGFLALGSVVLAVTGAEALYADMGHFGRPAITRAWLLIAFPALVLNYFGQGALVLDDRSKLSNPFYGLAPGALQIPLIVLATVATVVASQAVISGAFSMTRQAVQLGFLPRVLVRHTSDEQEGQIYVPAVNWILFASVAALVLGFRSSSHLASAYGLAVTATLTIDTVLALVVVRRLWHRPLALVALGGGLLLLVDLAFLGAQVPKVVHGGWFPIAAGAVVFTLLTTWWRGRRLALDALAEREVPLAAFLRRIREDPPTRVEGTAVYLTAVDEGVPSPLVRNLERNHILHRHVVLVTSRTRAVPRLRDEERLVIERLGADVVRLVVSWGFLESPDIPWAVRLARSRGVELDDEVTYFLSHITLNSTRGPGMALWRKHLFAAMSKNSLRASTYLGVPSEDVVELGTQLDI